MGILSSNRPFKSVTTQCEIDGVVKYYDGCSSDSLKDAKIFYSKDKWEYIGSSKVYIIDGVRNYPDKIHHFFKRK